MYITAGHDNHITARQTRNPLKPISARVRGLSGLWAGGGPPPSSPTCTQVAQNQAALRTSAATAAAAPQPSTWAAMLERSVLTFASADLECLYQGQVGAVQRGWAIFQYCHTTLGWALFAVQYCRASRDQRALLPVSVILLGLPHLLMTVLFLAALLLKPLQYEEHRRAIVAINLGYVASCFRCVRVVTLWMHKVRSPGGPVQAFHGFFVENAYLTVWWMLVIAHPLGLVPDLFVATAALLVDLGANRLLCGLPALADGMVSMSGLPLAVPQAVATVLMTATAGNPPASPLPCTTALAFWQVAGWWATSVAVFVVEALRRRVFLRSPGVLALLGPAHKDAAKRWPLGNVRKVHSILAVLLGITYAACVFYAIAVTVLD